MENSEYKIIIYPGLVEGYFKIKLNGESQFLDIKCEDFPKFLSEYKFIHTIKNLYIINKA